MTGQRTGTPPQLRATPRRTGRFKRACLDVFCVLAIGAAIGAVANHGRADARWVELPSTPMHKLEADLSSIETDGTDVTAWTRVTNRDGTFAVAQDTYHCATQGETSARYVEEFDAHGAALYPPDTRTGAAVLAPPDSPLWTTFRFVCRKDRTT